MGKVRLGDVAREYKETCKGSKDGLPIVGLEHLTPEEITLTMWDEEKENTFTKIFRKGQVLFGRRRAYLKKAAVAPFDGICSGDITIIEAIHDRILPELLPFIIQNDSLFDFAVSNSAGSLSPRVKWEHLKNFEFVLPELNKQKSLVEILWTSYETREAYKKLLAETDDLIKAQFIEMFGDPSINSRDWKVKTIGAMCSKIMGGGTPSKSCSHYYEGTTPWVTPKDMKSLIINDSVDHISSEAVENSSAKIVPKESVLMVIRSGILKRTLPIAINSVPVTLNQDMKAFITNEHTDPWFLLYSFKMWEQYLLTNVRGVTADNIEFSIIKNLETICPPIELQYKFAEFVQQTNKSISELQQTILDLEGTVKSLKKQIFS